MFDSLNNLSETDRPQKFKEAKSALETLTKEVPHIEKPTMQQLDDAVTGVNTLNDLEISKQFSHSLKWKTMVVLLLPTNLLQSFEFHCDFFLSKKPQ